PCLPESFVSLLLRPPISSLFPYTTLFRSLPGVAVEHLDLDARLLRERVEGGLLPVVAGGVDDHLAAVAGRRAGPGHGEGGEKDHGHGTHGDVSSPFFGSY